MAVVTEMSPCNLLSKSKFLATPVKVLCPNWEEGPLLYEENSSPTCSCSEENNMFNLFNNYCYLILVANSHDIYIFIYLIKSLSLN